MQSHCRHHQRRPTANWVALRLSLSLNPIACHKLPEIFEQGSGGLAIAANSSVTAEMGLST